MFKKGKKKASGICPYYKAGDCYFGGKNTGKCSWQPKNYTGCFVYKSGTDPIGALYGSTNAKITRF